MGLFTGENALLEKVERHDRFQFEVKLDYPLDPDADSQAYTVETYFFLAGSLNVWAKDTMQFQATYGHGIFHYINDNFVNNDVTYDNRGQLTALPFLGLMVGYTHPWSDRFRSTATFGYNNINNEPAQGALAYHETYYTSLNVMYQLRKRLTIGLEGLYGRKEVQDGTSGDVFRIQVSLVYSLFPSGVE